MSNNGNGRKNAQHHSRIRETPIAIVGMASLMPDARALDRYWSNIMEKVNSIVDVPPSRWDIDEYYDADPSVPDKTYCKRGAFMPEIDFNPIEFGLPPNILEVTDSGQLLSLVVAKDVLEDAGITEESTYDRDRIGCVLGVGGGQKLSAALTARLQYPVIERILRSSGVPEADIQTIIEKYKANYVPWEENSFPGLLGNVIAGRIANRFNLGGMNSVVDAACASSLSAVKLAIAELLEGHSDMMISGGVCSDNSIFMYMSFSKTPAFTQDEFIKPFDSDSKGMMIGEGIGMVALKRLPDAERDGDRIYATIRGIGSSSDGKFKSIYAPRPQGQAKALRRAYADAGYAPSTVGLIEAHGTGTAAGDVAEVEGLKEVFGADNPRKQHIALGSVKSQIGHLKAAAGAAGLIKAALALHHKVLPPTLSVTTPNPKMNLEASPFYVNSGTRPWVHAEDGSPRRASVSAFGFGGTNFHVTMEEYTPTQDGAYRLNEVAQPSLLAAENSAQLLDVCRDALAALEAGHGCSEYAAFLTQTALREIPESHARVGFVSCSSDEAILLLRQAIDGLQKRAGADSWETPQGVHFRSHSLDQNGAIVALFSGQGSQYVGMGSALACNFPSYLESVQQMDRLYTDAGQPRLSDRVFPVPVFDEASEKANEAALQQTQFAQPGIGTFSAGAYKILKHAGFKPDFVAGHSFGELTALWAAGAMDEDAFYRLAKARGDAMAAPDHPEFDSGTMAVIFGDLDVLDKDLEDHPEIQIANYNSKTQVVIAGPNDAMAATCATLKEQGFKVIPLPVSAAFHTPLVGHAQEPFADAVDGESFTEPRIPVFSNTTGEPYETAPGCVPTTLKNHMQNPVRFTKQIENLHDAGGRIFVEFGPKNILSPLVANILEGKPHLTVAINPNPKKNSDTQLREAALQLAVAGIPLSNLDPHGAHKPAYNTEKQSPLKTELSAPNYLSEKFLEKRDAILNDGFKLSTAAPTVVAQTQQAPDARTSANGSPSPTPASTPTVHADGLEESLAQFYQHERETLRIHERYLETPRQYSETFHALMEQQLSIVKAHPNAAIPAGVERSMLSFHDNQAETLKIHEQFIAQQAETTRSTLNLLREHHSLLTGAPAAPKPAPQAIAAKPQPVPAPSAPAIAAPPKLKPAVQSAPSLDAERISATMLDVVAEKTGYPTDMLELSMDMEADLGIDSIKRVEILGAVQETHPELPEFNAEVMAELRTLGEIVEYMNAQLGAQPAAAIVVSASPSRVDADQVTRTMLEVVADKTGYPTDMLELSMDMEADLGIDSIKRVEILGAVQETYPELPEFNAEVMAELRTLEEIVNYMSAQLETQPASPVATSSLESANIDPNQITRTMLEVVAEKTGYPTDMLELSMDMEADLGIDSIKRVEILGAVQETYPELPEFNAEVMAELRTLEEIVNYMNQQIAPSGAATATPAQHATPQTSGLNIAELTDSMLRVVSDKTGYPVDMLELSMDMEADLGIDSIKRVEILGAVQEEYPDLPDVDAEVLGEQRTLDEIIQCFLKTDAGPSVPKSLIEVVDSLDIPSPIARRGVRLQAIPMPDTLEEAVPADRCCIITDDGTNLTNALAAAMTEQGWKVALLSPPQVSDASTDETGAAVHRKLDDLDESTLTDALATIESELGTPARLIHLNPVEESDEQAKALLRWTFLLAKHVGDSLKRPAGTARCSFMTVARLDGRLGYGGKTFNAIPGGLFGLTKTVNLEWPDVFCRAIDIAPDLDAALAVERILGECADPNRNITEVGHSADGRFTLAPDAESVVGVSSAHAVNDQSVFVVSGGAKGVTAECVVALAAMAGGTYILLGRSGLCEIPDWAAGLNQEAEFKRAGMEHLKAAGEKPTPAMVQALIRPIQSTLAIQSVLARVEAAGGRAHYLSCDVTNADALRAGLNKLTSISGPVTGIIHGAGVLADKLIEKKTADDFDSVYGPKIEGLAALLSAVDPAQLRHLSLFSSAAGFFGNPAQSDYAIANDILNKQALDFKARFPECHVTTFNWGPWDGGMVTPELKKLFAQRNIDVIPIGEGSELFAKELMHGDNPAVQILVGSSMQFDRESASTNLQRYAVTRAWSVHENPFLADHQIDGHPVLPMAGVMGWMSNTCESLLPGYRFFSLENMKLLKGIVFLNGDIARYHLEIVEQEKNADHVTMDVTVWSGPADKRVNHYSATVTLVSDEPAAPVYDAFNAADEDAVDGAEYYQNGTLFHGPFFQAIERGLNATEQKLTLQCTTPVETAANLCAADAQFQSLLVWARQFKQAGALPTRFGRYEHYREIPTGQPFYLSLDIGEATNTRVNGTITIHDSEGLVYSRLLDAETTISKSLNFAAAVS